MLSSPVSVNDNTCLSTGSLPVEDGLFGIGEGLVLLSEVGCVGREDNISQCSHGGVAENRCSHFSDAGVICVGRSIHFSGKS